MNIEVEINGTKTSINIINNVLEDLIDTVHECAVKNKYKRYIVYINDIRCYNPNDLKFRDIKENTKIKIIKDCCC